MRGQSVSGGYTPVHAMPYPQRVALLLLVVSLACVLSILFLRPSTLEYLHTSGESSHELPTTTRIGTAAAPSPSSNSCRQGQEPAISFSCSHNDSERRYVELRVRLERTAKRVAAAGKEDMQEISRLLVSDLRELWQLDGRDQRQRQLAQQTAELVQRRLSALQNPQNCSTTRRLVCPIIGCGFGCRIHHVAYCLIVAYATQRTMVFPNVNKMYGGIKWNEIFQPLSNTCGYQSGGKVKNVSEVSGEQLVVQLPNSRGFLAYTPFHPPAIPEDLLASTRLFHGAPHAWWVGQVLHYLMRPSPRTADLIQGALKRLNFSTPIVGIHVRRGDKLIREAKYHSVDEYMMAVEDIYKTLEITRGAGERKIFVATDDVSVYKEINEKYPDYTVIGDQEVSNKGRGKKKYHKEALDGILVDIHLLSMCDFVVCTFSSNVCRLVYEMMQSLDTDASMRVTSLDFDYGYSGMQKLRLYRIILEHSARKPDEMNMKCGDIIALKFYNETTNYGYNTNTCESGYFPSFKAVEDAKSVPFPTYPYI